MAGTAELELLAAVDRERHLSTELAEDKRHAIEAEFRAAMTAIAACAFAIDAFYGTLVARFGSHPDHAKWRENRTSRHAQLAATFQYHLKLKDAGMPTVRQLIKEVQRFRDRAVHPRTEFVEPVMRADMDAGVEPRFVTYSADHARKVLGATVELLTVLVDKAKAIATGELAKWAEFAVSSMDIGRASARAIPDVQFPERPSPS